MAAITGVFILQDVYSALVAGEWTTNAYTATPPEVQFGWFGGGYNGDASLHQRIDYNNDTSTASARGPLSQHRGNLAATGNNNYGWFGGGYSGTPKSTVDRVDYTNDNTTATGRGSLSGIKGRLAATGNTNYGWFGGGWSGPYSVGFLNRVDYANDGVTASLRISSFSRQLIAATGNTEYGWFGGGFVNGAQAAVSRITYTNDTTSSPSGSLTLARQALAATGNSSYGWFGGGGDDPGPNHYSRVDRIDYSNDSVTASSRGPLNTARYYLAATGSPNFGWFGGGTPSNFPFTSLSRVDRISYETDTTTASVRGSFAANKREHAATGGFPG